ncbi:glycosyltransferase family 2 protein [Opitutales bacterium]|nr:glycosyltransferase family 2 protein [Opitutales bacterium]
MMAKLAELYYKLPWTANIAGKVVDSSYWLQVDRITLILGLRIPVNCKVYADIDGAELDFNFIPDVDSPYQCSDKEEAHILETTIDAKNKEAILSLSFKPDKKDYKIPFFKLPVGDINSPNLKLPIHHSIDGILDVEALETRILYGWCFALNPLAIKKIQARLDHVSLNAEYPLERMDVASSFEKEKNAAKCGFEFELPEDQTDGILTLECQLNNDAWVELSQTTLSTYNVRAVRNETGEKPEAIDQQIRPIYNVDTIFVEQQKKIKTKILGWIFLEDGPIISDVRFLYRDKETKCRYGLMRGDVQGEFPGQKNASNCGFEVKLDDIPGNPNLVFQFKLEGGSWIEFDQRKPSQISKTYYTDKKISSSKSGVRGNVENAQIGRRYGHQFMFVGWCFSISGEPVEEVRIRTGKQTFIGKAGLKRKDVYEENRESYPNSLNSGFEIPLDDIPRTAKLKFEYKNPKGKWKLFALEEFSRFPVSHFASQSEEKRDYKKWLKKYDGQLSIPKDKATALLDSLENKPLISVIMPVYNTPGNYLKRAIDSVIDQYYPHWELCIADDASPDDSVWELLESFAQKDERIKIVRREQNGHICAASNSALELSTGEWCAFLDHDDAYPKDALLRAVQFINKYPDAGLFYSDEDKLDEDDNRHDPYFKPEWNPELLEGQNYLCHLTVTKRNLVEKVGKFQPGLEGSQDWDLFLKITELLQTHQVVHIPYLLYHWRAIEGSTALALEEKGYIRESSHKTLEGHCERARPGVEIMPIAHGHWRLKYNVPQPAPLVSIIIPTKDQAPILRACIDSISNSTIYPNYEIIVVDNQSEEAETQELFEELKERNIQVLNYPKAFNFSAINNFAAEHANGEFLAFVNNDVTIINGEWLEEMISHACKDHVGAVGAKLYFPEDCIQHAGVILGINGVAGHCFKYAVRGEPGQRNRLNLVQQFSAVTAACLVVRKTIFEEVEGFEEDNLGVAFNDIDLCLRIKEAGYANIWTPHAQLYHHESVSRGDDNDQSRKVRVDSEIEYMRKRWGDLLQSDPTYNPNLTLEFEDFSLAWPPRLPKE